MPCTPLDYEFMTFMFLAGCANTCKQNIYTKHSKLLQPIQNSTNE